MVYQVGQPETGLPLTQSSAASNDAIEAKTGRRSVDRVIDAVGVTETMAVALSCARRDGTISVVGMGSPHVELSAFTLTVEERTVRGGFCYSPADFRRSVDVMAEGLFDPAVFVDHHVSLEQLPSSMVALATGSALSVKTLVQLTAEGSLGD